MHGPLVFVNGGGRKVRALVADFGGPGYERSQRAKRDGRSRWKMAGQD